MAKLSQKKFQLVIRDLEAQVGPVLTGRPPASSPVFVAVFGKAHGSNQTTVLGTAQLIKTDVLLGGPDTVEALKAGGRATMVGFAWVQGITNKTQARTVKAFGHRETPDASGQDMWAIELSTPTTAPMPASSLPPGALPASGWCFLFPWLSMCHRN